jgi:hypothetical protein
VLTPDEFIVKGLWKPTVSRRLFLDGVIKDPLRLQFLSIRPSSKKETICNNCDFLVKCKYDSQIFDAPTSLPSETKETRFIIDTIHGYYFRKIFIANNSKTGYTGLYMKPLSHVQNESDKLSLLLTTKSVTKVQQDSLVKMFFECKSHAPTIKQITPAAIILFIVATTPFRFL